MLFEKVVLHALGITILLIGLFMLSQLLQYLGITILSSSDSFLMPRGPFASLKASCRVFPGLAYQRAKHFGCGRELTLLASKSPCLSSSAAQVE